MFLLKHQNLCKNWDCYFWRFHNFLWKHPPTQTKIWLSLIKIYVVIGEVSLRTTEKTVKNTKGAANHIRRNPFFQTCDELMFYFCSLKAEVGCALQNRERDKHSLRTDGGSGLQPPGAPRQTEDASHTRYDSLDGFRNLQLLISSKWLTRYRQRNIYQRLCSNS